MDFELPPRLPAEHARPPKRASAVPRLRAAEPKATREEPVAKTPVVLPPPPPARRPPPKVRPQPVQEMEPDGWWSGWWIGGVAVAGFLLFLAILFYLATDHSTPIPTPHPRFAADSKPKVPPAATATPAPSPEEGGPADMAWRSGMINSTSQSPSAVSPGPAPSPIVVVGEAGNGRGYRVMPSVPEGYLNMREGPGAQFPVIQKLQGGVDNLALVGSVVWNRTTPWQQIESRGVKGWVNVLYLEQMEEAASGSGGGR